MYKRGFLFIKNKEYTSYIIFRRKNRYSNYVNPFKIVIWREFSDFKLHANFTKILQSVFWKIQIDKTWFEVSNWKEEFRMIDSELNFEKLGLLGRFQIAFFLHVVYSRDFFNLSCVEISYIMNTHQGLDEILEVSSTFYISKICIQLFFHHISCCIFSLVSFSRWRTNVQVGDTSRNSS